MTLEELLTKNPELADDHTLVKYGAAFLKDTMTIKSALIEYDEESVGWLAGPFAGKYGIITIIDWSMWTKLGTNAQLVEDVKKRLRKEERKIAASTTREDHKRQKWIKAQLASTDEEILQYWIESATQELPVALRIMGNDDSSFTRFCATVEEAIEVYDLLMACQPVNHQRDVMPMGFKFTN